MEKLKIFFVALCVLTVGILGLSTYVNASVVWYEDLRDYYPFGLWVTARNLGYEPEDYTILANDTYIQQAIDSGNMTWVQQDDLNSTYVKAGFPDYILWEPNGNFYRIHGLYIDGIPESWKLLPPPTETAMLLAIPWAVFGLTSVHKHFNKKG